MENAPSTCESESAMQSTSVCRLGVRDELHDDLGVRGGLEVGAIAFEPRADGAQVDQVAVVRNRDQSLGRLHADRLRIQQRRVAGRRIARVADGHRARQLLQHVVGEDLRHQPHALDVGQVLAVGRGDARRLLSAMLQRIEAEVGLPRRVGMPVNGDHAALFAQLVSSLCARERPLRRLAQAVAYRVPAIVSLHLATP